MLDRLRHRPDPVAAHLRRRRRPRAHRDRCPGCDQATLRKLYPRHARSRDHRAHALRPLAARQRAVADRRRGQRSSPTPVDERYAPSALRRRRRGGREARGEFVDLIDGQSRPRRPGARRRAGLRAALERRARQRRRADAAARRAGGGAGDGRRARRRARSCLSREIAAVDLRLADRMIVRLTARGSPRARTCSRSATSSRSRQRSEYLMHLFGTSDQHGRGLLAAARKSCSVLDVGSSKIVLPDRPADAARRRARRCAAAPMPSRCSASATSARAASSRASSSISNRPSRRSACAVDAAERQAGVTVESLIVNVSCGRLASETYRRHRRASPARRSTTAISAACSPPAAAIRSAPGRAVIHSLPIGYSLDGEGGIGDPRGMVGRAARRRHARGHRRRAAAAQSRALHQPLPPVGRAPWSPRPMPAASRRWSTTRPSSAAPASTSAAAPRPSPCSCRGQFVHADAHRRRRPAHHHRHRPRPVDPASRMPSG